MTIIHSNTRTTTEALADKVSITYGQFDQIALEAEKKASEDYEGYENDLVNFARLGDLYIGAILLALISLIIFVIQHIHGYGGTKLTLILGIAIFTIVKSMWVRFPKPEGIELTREACPQLFKLLDEICAKLNTTADVVLLTDDYNAGVTQFPTKGLLGGTTNYLILGLPYMMAKDEKQFVAVIAHEFGHLSSNHSKTGLWIYSLHERWNNLLKNLDANNLFFRPFFAWYIPRFEAKAGVMNRKHELEADQFSIDIAGADARSDSLVSTELKAHAYVNTWNEIYKQARTVDFAPLNVYDQLRVALNSTPTHDLRKWLNEALENEGGKSDTHPPLKARLAYAKRLEKFENLSDEDLLALVEPIEDGKSSAELFLGDSFRELVEAFNKSWFEANQSFWAEKHEEYKKLESALNDLREKEKSEELSLDDLRCKASLLEELDENEEAISVRHQILKKDPFDPISNFQIGLYLVNNKIESVESHDASHFLLRSYQHNLLIADSAHRVTAQHFVQNKREHELDSLKIAQQEIDEAMKERTSVKDSDEFAPNDLTDFHKEAFVEWLSNVKEVKSLYIVRKVVHQFPESKHYVIAINLKASADEFLEFGKVIREHSGFIDYTRSIVIFDAWTKKLEKKIKAVPDSLIFKRVKKS